MWEFLLWRRLVQLLFFLYLFFFIFIHLNLYNVYLSNFSAWEFLLWRRLVQPLFSIFIFCIHLFKFIYCLFVQQCVRVPVVEETCPTSFFCIHFFVFIYLNLCIVYLSNSVWEFPLWRRLVRPKSASTFLLTLWNRSTPLTRRKMCHEKIKT